MTAIDKLSEGLENQGRELLLIINPVVPALGMTGSEEWHNMRPLSQDVREFGWEGSLKLPSVQRMLASTVKYLYDKATALRDERASSAALVAEWRSRDDGMYGQVWTLAAEELERCQSTGTQRP